MGRLLTLLWTALLVVAWAGTPSHAADSPSAQSDVSDELKVVVTATRIQEPLADVPVSVEVIDQETLEEAAVTTLGDALRLVPGVSVRSGGSRGSVAAVSLRGSTSEQVLILVDGQPVKSPQGSFNLSDIPLADIERIEVVKGPGSSLFGADAVGGVINVITSPAYAKRGSRATVKSHGDALDVTASYGGALSHVDYSVTAGYQSDEGFRPNSDYLGKHLRLRLDRELSALSEGSLQVTWLSSETGVPGSTNFLSPNARQWDTQTKVDLSYLRDAAKGQIQATLYGRGYERKYRPDLSSSISEHDTVTVGSDVQRDFYLKGGVLTVGAAVRSDHAESTDLEGGKQEASSGAVYTQLVRDLTPEVSLTAGARLDAHSDYSAPLSPRIGVKWETSPGTTLRASAGRAFRVPTFDELYWDGFGNPDLEPENGWTYELGGRHTLATASLDWAVFRRRMENLIQWTDDNGIQNVAESRTDGMDLAVTIPLSRGLEARAGFTALDATNLGTGEPIQLVPSHESSLGVRFDGERTQAGVDLHYRGSRPIDAGTDLPAYTTVDGRANYALNSQVEVFAEGRNLLDTEYEESPGYPMPGRALWLGLTYSY